MCFACITHITGLSALFEFDRMSGGPDAREGISTWIYTKVCSDWELFMGRRRAQMFIF